MMTYPSWRQRLSRSLHIQRSKVESKFFQVASIDKQGHIQNRTMVFRAFREDSNDILAITDIRSQKYLEWLNKAEAQICWYFSKSREQYRLSTQVSLISHDIHLQGLNERDLQVANTIRKKVWTNLSDKAKQQFSWPVPKEVLTSEQKNTENDERDEDNQNFVVVVFKPFEVDYLSLKTTPQTREIHRLEDSGNWQSIPVNP